jgi:predicted acetyltransferase
VSAESERIREETYLRPELPLHLEVQVLAFARILWGDAFTGEDRFRDRMFDEPGTVHFVRTVGVLLISHVQVSPVEVEPVAGEPLRIGGVGGVMTYPQFRREGHASALMERAGTHIHEGAFDVGMLFCDVENVAFYEALGWRVLAPGRVEVAGRVTEDMVMTLGDASLLPKVLRLNDSW